MNEFRGFTIEPVKEMKKQFMDLGKKKDGGEGFLHMHPIEIEEIMNQRN